MPVTDYYTAEQVREMDRRAIEEHGMPGYSLMYRAGQAAFRELLAHWPQCESLLICCGPGNNGGDGYIVAGLGARAGFSVTVLETGQGLKTGADARQARDFCLQQGVAPSLTLPASLDHMPASTVIVDALLGTGTRGEIAPPFSHLIDLINSAALPVLAIDIPTGLNSDTGTVCGKAVKADATVTFIAHKAGQVLGDGPVYSGHCRFDDLGVPAAVSAGMVPAVSC